ncbi:MAG TPA: hypothetical protein VMZ71_00845 [Gemmataceae bacterium]|nr:hypothetical protein [Gemmataceae bacterium]
MKKILAATAAALFALTSVACNKSPEGGSPGTKDSFTVTGPTMSTTIKQGNKETVTITLNRGSDFKKKVALDAKAPDKVKVTMDKNNVMASDDKDVKLTIDVDKEAPVGDHVVEVTATPESGATTKLPVKITVAKP